MRVIICGSRNWTNVDVVAKVMQRLPSGTTVIHGAAKGADTIAGVIAEHLGFDVMSFPVTADEWATVGKRAGIIRNRLMLDQGPELVIAFLDDTVKSSGTRHMVDIAEAFGVKTLVIKRSVIDDLCSTCFQSYRADETSACSSAFHCCRECTWVNGVVSVRCERHT